MSHDDPFFDVPRTMHATSTGDVELPILYYDASCLLAFFAVNKAAATRALHATGLVPALTLAGRALVGIACYEYRDTTVGVYNEVGVAIPALPAGTARPGLPLLELYRPTSTRQLGFYVLDLPVTTEAANAAGRELWGYPKFVTRIPVQFEPRHFFCEVADPDGAEPIMTLDGKLGLGLPTPALSLLIYSHMGDRDLRTEVTVRGPLTLRCGRSMQLCVGESKHPMAANLRDLGLDGARPLATMETRKFQSRLNEGLDIVLRTEAERATP